MLISIAQIAPVFAIVAYLSTPEKALVASITIWAIWAAISARKEGWKRPGFWWIVAFIGAVNTFVIWAIPTHGRFTTGMIVAYPLGMAEGFFVYWLLGWWLGGESEVR